MNKMLIGSAVGLAMGIGLMMLPGIRQDVQKGANKVKKAVQDMSEGQQKWRRAGLHHHAS